MWRVHFFIMVVLEQFMDRRPDVGTSFLVQLAKVVQQVAVDGGSWHTAASLLPEADPLGREVFGGCEEELEAVHRYQRGVKELQTHLKKTGKGREEEGL